VIVGFETSDDAGVYRLNESTALIQTVDFFTPIVDDPYLFGSIAAANALSDIYAMGGKPLTAMNIVCYPAKDGDLETLRQILHGGADKVAEAGAVVLGGHSVEDREPKYGLAVTGVVAPNQVITNRTARPGDALVLTKPLGTGIIATAAKAELAPPEALQAAARTMATLNAAASEAMRRAGAHACTDITGFGLLGHAHEMAAASGVGLLLFASAVPLLPGVEDLAAQGLIPAGAHANRSYLCDRVRFDPDVPLALQDVLFDPQTSGGLLIAVPKDRAASLLEDLAASGVGGVQIGEVTAGDPGRIRVAR